MSLLDTLYLFRWTVAASLLCGATLPLLGAFLLLRRSGFHGLVLPQVATAGVALGYALLPLWIAHIGLFGMSLDEALKDPHAASGFLLVWAAIATAVALWSLAIARGSSAPESARLAAWFAGSWAAAVLLGSFSPIGTEWIDGLLRGELLAVDVHGFETLAVALPIGAWLVVRRFRHLALASLDPIAARVLGLLPGRREAEFAVALGLAAATTAVVVGPLVGFSLLVLPPLAAHRLAGSLAGFLGLSVGLGLLNALLGLVSALAFDLPIGASLAAVGGLLVLAVRLVPVKAAVSLSASPGRA